MHYWTMLAVNYNFGTLLGQFPFCVPNTLDFTNGYWQVEVAEGDREKTAFTTGRGLYQWWSMPMGLTNSPATCQRMMELVLRGLPWQVCMVYLDDELIYSPTFEGHLSIFPSLPISRPQVEP